MKPFRIYLFTSCVALFSWTVRSVPPVQFATPTKYYPTQHPYAVCVADFDHDGNLDLATANWYSPGVSSVSLLLGKGDGTFYAPTNFAYGFGGLALAAADLNGDGHLDLAIANYDSNAVSVLFGNGDGTFLAGTNFAAGLAPYDVAIAELSGDSNLDIAVANSGAGTVTILQGDGTGGFPNSSSVSVGADPRSLALVDMNGDGHLDLVVGKLGDDSIAVLTGDGAGTFMVSTNFNLHRPSFSIAAGDFNGDGSSDIVSVDSVLSWSMLLGNGVGGFASCSNSSLSQARSIAVADFNGDGIADLVLGAGSGGSGGIALVFLGKGDGTFVLSLASGGLNSSSDVAVGDFNKDGKPDIVAVDWNGKHLLVLLNESAPELKVKPLQGMVELSWPNWAGYALESTPDLGGTPAWNLVTDSPVVENNRQVLRILADQSVQFYRLRKL